MATMTESRTGDMRMSTPINAHLNVLDWVALVLMIIGGINWGLVGVFDYDLVAAIFGDMTTATRVVYAIVGLAALYGIALAIRLASNRSSNALA